MNSAAASLLSVLPPDDICREAFPFTKTSNYLKGLSASFDSFHDLTDEEVSWNRYQDAEAWLSLLALDTWGSFKLPPFTLILSLRIRFCT